MSSVTLQVRGFDITPSMYKATLVSVTNVDVGQITLLATARFWNRDIHSDKCTKLSCVTSVETSIGIP